MSWDDVIEAVNDRLPQFNSHTLVGYRESQVMSMPDFVGHIYNEAAKLFGDKLIYKGYHCLTPEARLEHMLTSSNTSIKGQYNIQLSEVVLYEYVFEYEGIDYPVHIYLPYMNNGALQIKDTKYYIQHAIIERTIYRIEDGIIIKVMRSPIQFWRTEQLGYTDVHGQSYMDAIITSRIYFGKTKSSSKKTRVPLILYLLVKFSLDEIVSKIFGLPLHSISFVSEPDLDDTEHSYFECNKNVYLKVDTESVMHDTMFRRLVASILYILKMAKNYNIDDVYNVTFYRIILGRRIHSSNAKDGLAVSHALLHIDSLDTYMDYYTRNDLLDMGLDCNSIYDLLAAVFFHIDVWLLDYSPNNLFGKRIGGLDIILSELVKSTFKRFYNTRRKKLITCKEIRNMLKMDPMRVSSIGGPSVRSAVSMYAGNMLLTTYIKKTRQTGSKDGGSRTNTNLRKSKDHQFHISFPAVESVLAISSNSPGSTGDINPFAAIDRKGNFVEEQMPWVKTLECLNKYLVQS